MSTLLRCHGLLCPSGTDILRFLASLFVVFSILQQNYFIKYRPIFKIFQENISRAFCVTGIPHLVFLDVESGDILCSEGRGKVCCDPNATSFPWA